MFATAKFPVYVLQCSSIIVLVNSESFATTTVVIKRKQAIVIPIKIPLADVMVTPFAAITFFVRDNLD